ncbi:MAG: hypothetical protein LBG83_05710 [Oscillospiraceae bacterium]|jgi:hypothetical protein|nr:hypothetical protein [Oscillospiraceae bacterium]
MKKPVFKFIDLSIALYAGGGEKVPDFWVKRDWRRQTARGRRKSEGSFALRCRAGGALPRQTSKKLSKRKNYQTSKKI